MVYWSLDRSCSRDFKIFFINFSHFLRGHQELSVNTSHVIFGEIMSIRW